MGKHTPGPWEWGTTTPTVLWAAGDTAIVLCVDEERRNEIEPADAALIAAAPDLLAALEALYALVQGESPALLEDDHHDEMIRAAIDKAKDKRQ